jgi:hypothetical protein
MGEGGFVEFQDSLTRVMAVERRGREGIGGVRAH